MAALAMFTRLVYLLRCDSLNSISCPDYPQLATVIAFAVYMLTSPAPCCCPCVQRHWTWLGLDQSFRVQTEAMGDLHHFAWRATLDNQTVYLDPDDRRRYCNLISMAATCHLRHSWCDETCFSAFWLAGVFNTSPLQQISLGTDGKQFFRMSMHQSTAATLHSSARDCEFFNSIIINP